MKTIWNALGDIRVAFSLLLAASATLFCGAFYAKGNFSLFMELNRHRIQDWLPAQLVDQPEVVWWIPLLFLIMGLLGVNIFICATNRVFRLIHQRQATPPARLFHLLIPSMVHFLFIMIMIGHLITFTAGKWQTLPLATGILVTTDSGSASYEVTAVDHRFFPESSVLRDRIAQTSVTLMGANRQATRLEYTHPVSMDGHYFLLDKIKKKTKRSEKARVQPSTSEETCNKAHVYKEADHAPKASGQMLLVISDPGLAVIITGLTLIMILMVGYFLFRSKSAGF